MSLSRYIGWLWLASSLPVGLLLLLLPEPARGQAFVCLLSFDLAHSLSPVVMSWRHPEFRRIMLRQPGKYLGLPALLLSIALAVGLATSLGWTSYHGGMYRITDWRNPYPLLMWVYAAWNIYHFGMQHYGALALWRRPKRKTLARLACMGLSTGWMVGAMAIAGTVMGTLMGAVNSFNHWAVELGLGFRAMGYRWYVLMGLLAAGAAWVGLTVYRTELIPFSFFPLVMCLRLIWMGGTHFLYSRWGWGPSSPIRRDLVLAGAS